MPPEDVPQMPDQSANSEPVLFSAHLFEFATTFRSAITASYISMLSGSVLLSDIEDDGSLKFKANGYGGMSQPNSHIISSIDTVVKSIKFSQETMYCRVVDSFEFYLKKVLNHSLDVRPNLMLKRKKGNKSDENVEASIPYSFIIERKDLGMENLMDDLINKFSERLLSKRNAYLEIIDFLKSSGAKIDLRDEDLELLKLVFEIRNSITHENGHTPYQNLLKVRKIIEFDTVEPYIGCDDISKTSNAIFRVATKIDSAIRNAFYKSDTFIYGRERFQIEFDQPQNVLDRLIPIIHKKSPS